MKFLHERTASFYGMNEMICYFFPFAYVLTVYLLDYINKFLNGKSSVDSRIKPQMIIVYIVCQMHIEGTACILPTSPRLQFADSVHFSSGFWPVYTWDLFGRPDLGLLEHSGATLQIKGLQSARDFTFCGAVQLLSKEQEHSALCLELGGDDSSLGVSP